MRSGFILPKGRRNVGKTRFAQGMEFVPWKTFGRISHALAVRLIVQARALYAEDAAGLGLDASVYALDSAPIDYA